MSFLDNISPQFTGGKSITPTAPVNDNTSTQESHTGGSFLDNVSKQYTEAKPVSVPHPSSQEASYFATTTSKGYSFGPSKDVDPYSGKPLLDFRNPGDTSTTTDKTRVDTTFDPMTAQPEDKSVLDNPRMPESASQAIRKTEGATSGEQLDHRMALSLSGSNDISNLKLIPTNQNQAAGQQEEQLNADVKSGKISLFEAQAEMAKAKNLKQPFTAGTVEQPKNIWDNIFGGAKNIASTVQKTAQGGYDSISKATSGLINSYNEGVKKVFDPNAPTVGEVVPKAALEVAHSAGEGLVNFFSDLTNLFENYAVHPAVKAVAGSNVADKVTMNIPDLSHNVEPGYEGASTAGKIIGGALPYMFGGEALAPISEALSNSSPLIKILGSATINTGLPALIGQVSPLQPGESHLSRFWNDLPGEAISFGGSSIIPNKTVSAFALGLSQFGIGMAKGETLAQNSFNSIINTIFGFAGKEALQGNIFGEKDIVQRAKDIMETDLGTNPHPQDVLLKNVAREILKSTPEEKTTFLSQVKALYEKWNSLPPEKKQGGYINLFGGEEKPEEEGPTPKPSDQFAVVRHGETANNKDGLNRGMLDLPLNENGKTGAAEIAKGLKPENIDGIISSPLIRAKQTASIISKANGTPILETNKGLLPWDIGKFQGKDIQATLPQLHALMDTPDVKAPGGESFNEFKDRTIKALKEIRDKYPDKKLAFVSHHRVERLTDAITSLEGGVGNFHVPIQKTKGIEPASFKTHAWEDMFPSTNKPEVSNNLAEEAKKYKSAEEFVNAQKRDYGMSHRPTETGATADNISQTKSDMGFPKDFYDHPEYYENMSDKSVKESFSVLQKIKDNPDATITIYRASPKSEFNRGDWVSLSKEYAKGESLSENTPIQSIKVKAKDVQFAGDSINEFGYYPEGKTAKESQLTDIWKQSNEGISKGKNTIFGRISGPKVEATKENLKNLINEAVKKAGFDPSQQTVLTKIANDYIDGNKEGLYENKVLPAISVMENNGKIGVKTAYHESYHYILDKFMPKAEVRAMLDQAKKDMGIFQDLKYRSRGYNDSSDQRAEEWLADKFAKETVEANGYKGKYQEFFGKIADVIQKTGQFLKDLKAKYDATPGKEAGSIKNPFAKEEDKVVPEVNPKITEEASKYASSEDYLASLNSRKASFEEALKNTPDDKVMEKALDGIKERIESVPKLSKDIFSPTAEVAKKPVIRSQKVEEVYQNLHNLNLEKSVLQEKIDNNPAKELKKYMSNTTGDLPEVTGKEIMKSLTGSGKDVLNSKFGRKGDDIVTELGFKSVEDAQKALNKHIQDENRLTNLKETVKETRKYLASLNLEDKDAKSLNYFLNQSFKDQGEEIHQASKEVQAEKEGYNIETMRSNGGVVPPKVRGGLRSPEVDFMQAKDKATIKLVRDTMERNIEDVFGKDAKPINDFMVEHIRDNETERIVYTDKIRDRLREVVNRLGIKKGSIEDKLVQLYGEKEITPEQLEGLKDKNIDWKKIKEASDAFRKVYDEVLDKWNETRAKFGQSPIPKRADYFRHFREMEGVFDQLGFQIQASDLPTSIAGETHYFKPVSPFTNASLPRIGKDTTLSAIGGMENYLNSVPRAIFHTDSIQRVNAFDKYLKESATENPNIKLSNFRQNLSDYKDGIAGKTSRVDLAAQSIFGRKSLKFFTKLKERFGANVIAGNISAALTHLLPVNYTLATVDKVSASKGLLETLRSPFVGDFTTIDGQKSSFLTRRFPGDKIDYSLKEKIGNKLGFVFKTADKFISKFAVTSKYYEGLKKGLSPEEAMKVADNYANRVIGDRSIGNLPTIMNTKTLGFLTQFQVEVNDNLSFLLKDIPRMNQGNKLKIASSYAQFAIYSYLFNQLMKNTKGTGKGFDPIDMGLTLAGQTGESKDMTIGQRLQKVGGDFIGEMPFSSILTGQYPLAQAIPIKQFTAGMSDIYGGQWGDLLTQVESIGKQTAANLASPIGGGAQFKKTIEGTTALITGKGTSGKTSFNVPLTPTNAMQAVLFGPSATSGGQANKQSTNDLYNLIQTQTAGNKTNVKAVEDFFSNMKETAKTDPNKAMQDLKDLYTSNPAEAKKVLQAFNDEASGITGTDRLIKQLDVNNGNRAQYIVKVINEMKTPEEKLNYIKDLDSKKIITSQVLTQITSLLTKK